MNPNKHEAEEASVVKSCLLTALGIKAIRTRYIWLGVEVDAELTPLAVLQLLPNKPETVIALVTADAQHTWELFFRKVHELIGVDAIRVNIPDGRSNDELALSLERAAAAVPANSRLWLDVTQGYRHFPFLLYALALYLSAFRGMTIEGALYGLIEGGNNEAPKPIIDLWPLLELPEWFHALRVVRETGSTHALAHVTQQAIKTATKPTSMGNWPIEKRMVACDLKALKNSLNAFGTNLLAGLPIEAGESAARVSRAANSLKVLKEPPVPLFSTLMSDMQAELAPLALGKSKQSLALDQAELLRQAFIIDLYLKREQAPLALGLLREWVVSLFLLHHPPTEGERASEATGWLKKSNRERAERSLGALAAMMRSDDHHHLDKNTRLWGEFLNRLQGLRNEIMHQGMKLESVKCCLPKEVAVFWNRIKDAQTPPPRIGGGSGRLLITPQGLAAGVLFSAIAHTRPHTALVVCSAESKASVGDACHASGFAVSAELCEVADPQSGFNELETLVKRWRPILLRADEIVANLTGGTTFLGLAVQHLAEEAKCRLDRPVRRFALVDRRSPQEQREQPFIQAEIHWLDGQPSS